MFKHALSDNGFFHYGNRVTEEIILAGKWVFSDGDANKDDDVDDCGKWVTAIKYVFTDYGNRVTEEIILAGKWVLIIDDGCGEGEKGSCISYPQFL